ncbi:type 4 prepilin-like proteins leader peptide-processing enzyme [Thalassotalea loyana]|uniref:Prepilin leader peptidase/N-methyltransferase n=1 Tax=Thalassotalea loyana TaxID=280483 RepID=A0ABQ6HEF4_9GAMM|nr:A24 family peptidase [Thalassotalea loyana]GLX85895.1 type 4 prepilin-like proteins leader peptide-processing enzyme [Thalassotalea loyana]
MFSETLALLEQSPSFFYTLVFVFSLMVGSFLNVVIYRFPKMLEKEWYNDCREFLGDEVKNIPKRKFPELTLAKPDSSCPNCNHKIRFYENIPVISWLWLRGKCSNCKINISSRYPIIELATALLSVAVSYHFGPTWTSFWVILLTWYLICLTMIDFDHMLLPDQLVYPMLWLGLLVNIDGTFISLSDAVIGAVAGYMSLFSVFWVFKLLTGKEGMGHGDFKLVAMFGAWFGWQLLPLHILMASVVAAVIGLSLIAFKQHSREKPIPFGPYLAVAGWITLLWGNDIWQWYLGFIVQ